MKISLPNEVKFIIEKLFYHHFEAYAVGGCIRDSLLGRTPTDWDICTNAKPEAVIDIFSSIGLKVIPIGLRFGTVIVTYSGKEFEITTYRIEGKYKNHRHPTNVLFARNVRDDLQRRDFTINAIAYNEKNGIIDPFQGVEDLQKGIIRCVGNPSERFEEDALRIIRGIRLATKLQFQIDEKTIKGMVDKKNLLVVISKERIREEFNKILLADKPSIGFQLLLELDLFDFIIPELKFCIGLDPKSFCYDKGIFDHILKVLDSIEKDLILRLAALLYGIKKSRCFSLNDNNTNLSYNHQIIEEEIIAKILRRLKYDNYTINQVKILVEERISYHKYLTPKEIKKFINRVGKENLKRFFQLQIADLIKRDKIDCLQKVFQWQKECEKILKEKQPLCKKDLDISGHDLLMLGIPQGRKIGRILYYLLEQVLEKPDLNQKEKLIKLAQNYILNNENRLEKGTSNNELT